MTHGYITIPKWARFQHRDAARTDAAITWIKDYTRQLSDDDYLNLTFHQRGILHGLRLEHARAGARSVTVDARQLHGSFTADTRRLSYRLGARVTMRDLKALEQAGFIEITPASGQHKTVETHEFSREEEIQKRKEENGVKADRSEGRGLSADKQEELNRILELADDRDNGSWNILYDAARGLPFASLAKVRESCLYERSESGRVGVGYAVNALRSEPRALRDAASFADFLEEAS